jgi:hypothetical protein
MLTADITQRRKHTQREVMSIRFLPVPRHLAARLFRRNSHCQGSATSAEGSPCTITARRSTTCSRKSSSNQGRWRAPYPAPYLSLFRCGLARTAAHSFLKCVNSVCIIASETARPNRRGNWFAKTEIKPLFGTRCFRTAVCFFNTASSAFR